MSAPDWANVAAEAGYVFYLEPGPAPGTSLAYFGPKINAKYPVPQPALNINMDHAIGMHMLAKATPDGYTIGYGPVSAVAIMFWRTALSASGPNADAGVWP